MRRLLSAAVLIVSFGHATADEPVPLRIDAQPMPEALRAFVHQTGMQVLFPAEVVTDALRARAVEGALSPEMGLASLLAESGLRYKFVNAHTVAIMPVSDDVGGASGSSHAGSATKADNSSAHSSSDDDGISRRWDSKVAGIPEVLIKGSRSLNADIERTRDDVRPYVILTREAIEMSGAANVDDFLRKRLTMSYVPAQNNQTALANSTVGNQSKIALRGLAGSETLILIDGRRVTTRRSLSSEFQGDLNSIPLASIERIEVLPAAASGIYGGSATGGVINVVLRRDYSGLETSLTFEDTAENGGAMRAVSVYGGLNFHGGATSLLFSGNYSDTDPLRNSDRDFFEERRRKVVSDQIARDPVAFFNSASPILGATPNISSTRVAGVAPNLVLKNGQALGSPITSVPAGYLGVDSDGGAALVANAGTYNLDLANSTQFSGGQSGLLGAPKLGSLSATLRRQFSPTMEAFLDVSAASNRQYFAASGLLPTFILPANAPNNPFQQRIIVAAPVLETDTLQTESDDRRLVAGFAMKLPRDWSAALDYSISTSVAEQTAPPGLFASALTSITGILRTTTDINLISDPSGYSDAVRSYKLPPNSATPTRSRLNDASIRLAGPVGRLPAGAPALSVLLEHRKQYFGEWSSILWQDVDVPDGNHFSDASSTTGSIYAELRIPIASESLNFPGLRAAEVQVAARLDRYSLRATRAITASDPPGLSSATRDFDSVDPSVGVRLQPLRGLTLRASYGTGFLPPYLGQLQPGLPSTVLGSQLSLTDPKRGNEPVGLIELQAGGRTDLRPENSESWSAGVVFTPRILPEFRLSLDWVSIRKTENIVAAPTRQEAIDNEDIFAEAIVRDVPSAGDPFGVGRIIGIDSRLINATRARYDSLDIALDYSFATQRFGKLAFSAGATKLVNNILQTNPLLLPVERAGLSLSPTWAANATLTWGLRNLTLAWTAQYLDSFWFNSERTIDEFEGSDHLPSEVYHDIAAEYEFDEGAPSILSNTVLRFGVKNVFNTPPRFSATGSFYDLWCDPRMATYYVSVSKSFSN